MYIQTDRRNKIWIKYFKQPHKRTFQPGSFTPNRRHLKLFKMLRKSLRTLVKAYFRTIRSESVVFTWITKTTLISNVVIATISISNILTCMHGTQIDERNSKVRSIVQFKPFKFEVFIFEYSSTFVD